MTRQLWTTTPNQTKWWLLFWYCHCQLHIHCVKLSYKRNNNLSTSYWIEFSIVSTHAFFTRSIFHLDGMFYLPWLYLINFALSCRIVLFLLWRVLQVIFISSSGKLYTTHCKFTSWWPTDPDISIIVAENFVISWKSFLLYSK